MLHGKRNSKRRNSKRKGRTKALTVLGVAGALSLAGGAPGAAVGPPHDALTASTAVTLSMRKKSPTLVCRPSIPLTTKTSEHVVPAYNLPGSAADRGRAEAAQ
jgi:hypothetical protein